MYKHFFFQLCEQQQKQNKTKKNEHTIQNLFFFF